MRALPSPWTILRTDNRSYQLTWLGTVCLVLALLVKLTGTVPGGHGRPDRPVDPGVANLVLASAAALTALLGSIVALRVARIRGLLDSGDEVEAEVRKVSRFRGGARLALEFERDGRTHRVRWTYQRWSRTPIFVAGMRVVARRSGEPRRAVPVDARGRGSNPAQLGGRHARADERPGPGMGTGDASGQLRHFSPRAAAAGSGPPRAGR